MRIRLITAMLVSLSGCGVGLLNQKHAESRIIGTQKPVVLSDLASDDDECAFNVDSSQAKDQEAACEKSDASVVIPPGALAIPSTVSISQQGDIYSALAASGMNFLPAGSAVAVTAGQNSELSSPMTINLPTSGGAGLADWDGYYSLDDSAKRAEDYSVIHRCLLARCADEKPRILTDIRGQIVNGKFQFKTKLLGVFQLANAARQEELLPPIVLPVSGDYDTPVKATVQAVSGVSYRYVLGSRGVPNCKDSPEFTDTVEVLSNGNVSYLKVIACNGSQPSRGFATMKYRIKPIEPSLLSCGGPKTGSCYDVSGKKLGLQARIEGSNFLVYLAPQSRSCSDVSCMIWREGTPERPGDRIINSRGLWARDVATIWQKALLLDGKAFRTFDFSMARAVGIAGRVCPPKVFLPQSTSESFSSDRCLYFDEGTASPVTLTEGAVDDRDGALKFIRYLASWLLSDSRVNKWYQGNTSICGVKGMRLPTLFETSATDWSRIDRLFPTDDVKQAEEFGVPPVGMGNATWTATGIRTATGLTSASNPESGRNYGVWIRSSDSAESTDVAESRSIPLIDGSQGESAYVRCVIPSN